MIIVFTKIYRALTRFGPSIVLLIPLLAIADTQFTGKVVKIADGDTLTVLVDRQQIWVRLAQIDCPERAQPWSNKAKQALSEHVFGKMVEVFPLTKDRYRRTVAKVVADGANVNRALVRDGHCWVYRKYARDESLFDIEREAREQMRGLWSLP